MENIQNLLREKAHDGQISKEDALAIGKHADGLLTESVAMLTELKKHVGLFLGGDASMLIGKISRTKLKDEVYFFEKEPDGQ